MNLTRAIIQRATNKRRTPYSNCALLRMLKYLCVTCYRAWFLFHENSMHPNVIRKSLLLFYSVSPLCCMPVGGVGTASLSERPSPQHYICLLYTSDAADE